jgi:uncharacterized membrane protein YdjX (TVP38/TMEM64 family)
MSTPKASNDVSALDQKTDTASTSWVKRFFPVFIIVAFLVAFFALGGPKYINLQSLRDNQEMLKSIVEEHAVLSILGFMALYAFLVGISVPGAGFLSIFAGFLFGVTTGTFSVVIGATLGATMIFLAARSALGESLAQKAGPFMKKFEKGLQKNELSYLFILRLVPLFPFFIVNIVPALFDVKLRNYVISTFIGIIPGSLVYVSVGNGLGDALRAGEDIPLSGLMFRPAVILPILGLILLSLIPVVYQRLSGKNKT